MSTQVCMIHGVPEEDMPGDYGSCLECCHIWRTPTDWARDCVALAALCGEPADYETTVCPLCSHDLYRPPWMGQIDRSPTVERDAALIPGPTRATPRPDTARQLSERLADHFAEQIDDGGALPRDFEALTPDECARLGTGPYEALIRHQETGELFTVAVEVGVAPCNSKEAPE